MNKKFFVLFLIFIYIFGLIFNPTKVFAAGPIISWTGPTSGSQDMYLNPSLPFTVSGVYTVTVSNTLPVNFGGAAGGGGGGSTCSTPDREAGGYGGGDGGGGGASTGASLMSITLYPSKSYQIYVGAGGVANSPGGETSIYNITDGFYILRLQGGTDSWGGGVYVGSGVGGAKGGQGGWIYENGQAGGTQPTGAGGGGGSGGSCDWGVSGSGGTGGGGGGGVGGPGTSGGRGAVSCYNQTPGGGGGGWSYSGLPAYYGGGGGGAGACGNYGYPGSGGGGAFIFKAVVPSGTLTPTGSSCVIASGTSSCNINYSWNTTNTINTSAVTKPTNVTVATGNSGTSVPFAIKYSSETFYLYNNAALLAQSTVTSSCIGGTTWNGSSCVLIYQYQYQYQYPYPTPYGTPYAYPTPVVQYSITVTKTNSAGGTVNSSNNAIVCGSTCTGNFNTGTTVVLKATPASTYWKFTGWTGNCTGTSATCTLVNVTSPKTTNATFAPRFFNYKEF